MQEINIIVIGLGYVGLPLAVEFGKKYPTLGIDIDAKRIEELNNGHDRTMELEPYKIGNLFKWAEHLEFSSVIKSEPSKRNIFIVTVPTPIDNFKNPDLGPLKSASKAVGEVLEKGDIVIYESTVYPGCTEEDCVPVLEKQSGLKFNIDFFCGYSPERINPGDKQNTLTKILKITSGSNPETAETVDKLYKSIISAGTYKAPSIKVAEGAKIVENCQRDVNISFVNELALIFDKMDIDTHEVLKAAGTKWNFLNFSPGLVGGHCIGVDPYYMIHKSESLGYFPAVIGAGRRINDNMGRFVANKCIKLMIQKGIPMKGAKALILGITFKENCPDIRNTRVLDIYNELLEYGLTIDIYDPWADSDEVKQDLGIELSTNIGNNFDLIIHAVSHKNFESLQLEHISNTEKVIFDIKSTIKEPYVDARL
jgi:UDP-N-acetyl-D-glucosamine/UDP-N-acetyl-D-galactosamine dehydrogenase